MRRVYLLLILAVVITGILFCGCGHKAPKGIVSQIIEPYMEFAHTVMYWETIEGKTALYEVGRTTDDITCLAYDLRDVQDFRTTGTSIYMLRETRDGRPGLTRIENDREMFTEVELKNDLVLISNSPWDASRNDVIAIWGKTESGDYTILKIEFRREEPEETFDPEQESEPVISWNETGWYSSRQTITDLIISDDGGLLAISVLEDESTGEAGLYFIDSTGVTSYRITEKPLLEMGGFSPDGSRFAAILDDGSRPELFIIGMDDLEADMVTRMALGNAAGHPAWHPNGRYIMFTIDYGEGFMENATTLKGEQLYLYSLDSNNSRRLAAFEEMKLWVDFSPVGDFFLYSSTPGVMSRTGRAVVVTDENSGLETWRISYVPWIPEEFMTGNFHMLTPDQTQHMVSYTVGGETKIGFMWGPGGELPPDNR